MKKEAMDFMMEYLNASSPTGFELEVQKLWTKYLKKSVDEVGIDRFNNAYVKICGTGNADLLKKKVVIEAHADEIGWFVNYISDKGFIHVIKLGGSDIAIARSKRVNIMTDKGIVRGLFGIPAIHVRNTVGEKVPKVEELFIDIGCSTPKEVEKLGVKIGCPILFDDKAEILNKNFIVGKALDDKIGGFVNAEVMKNLSKLKKKLKCDVIAVNSSQEEIGLRGAEMMAYKIKPDLAICIDVTHETNHPEMKKEKHGDISFDGCVLTISPQVDIRLNKHLEDVAKKYKIKIQHQVAGRSTGTDTDSFAYCRGGIPSVLISMPLRYMHTTVEMMKLKTVEETITLLTKALTEGINEIF